jgi:hypothetical protein
MNFPAETLHQAQTGRDRGRSWANFHNFVGDSDYQGGLHLIESCGAMKNMLSWRLAAAADDPAAHMV